MAKTKSFKKGAAASNVGKKAISSKQQKGTKPPFPGAKSKAQGGTAHRMSKPEGGKGKLRGAMSKGKAMSNKGKTFGNGK